MLLFKTQLHNMRPDETSFFAKCQPTTRDPSVLSRSPRIQLSIQISPQKKATLSLHPQDNPLLAARKFCFQNNLDFRLINPISKRIDLLLNEDQRQCSMRHISIDQEADHKPDRAHRMQIPQRGVQHLNSGVMMYQRCKRLGEIKKKKISERLQEIQSLNDKQLTFKPDINPVSRLLVDRLEQEFGRESFYERNSQIRRSRVISMQKSKEKEEMRECTFQPKINTDRSLRNISTSMYLQNLAKPKKNDSLLKNQPVYPYHPKINQISELINNGVSFEERQQKYEYEKVMRKSLTRLQKPCSSLRNSSVKNDRLTVTRNLQRLPIGQYLYNQRHNRQLQVEKVRETLETKPIRSNPNSSKIYENNKLNSFSEIFRCLDSNNDQLVSASKISIEDIPSQLVQIVAPLLSEMEELSIELSQEQFLNALDKLYSTLNVAEKNKLLRFARPTPPKHQECTFKPEIDEKSSILALKVRDFDNSGVSLYDFCEQRKSLLDQKLEQRRREKENQEFTACTFKPLINK